MQVTKTLVIIFKNVYLFCSIISLLFILLGLGYIGYYNPSAVYNFAEQCAVIFIDTLLFFIWFRVFANLVKIMSHSESSLKKAQINRNTGMLLIIIFSIQFLENCLYVFIPDLTPQRDWSVVSWPSADLGAVQYIFGIYFIFLKLFHYWKAFLLPSVYGIGAFILALIIFSISKNENGGKSP